MNSCGWDERLYLDYAKKHLNSNAILMDVGANLGDFTDEFLKAFPDGKAFCFEPIPEIYNKLYERFEHNENVCSFNKGLWCNGTYNSVPLYYVKNWSGMSSLYDRPAHFPRFDVEKINVKMTDIDEVFGLLPHIDYLKIDVEGSELNVMMGAESMLYSSPPKFIQYEVGETYNDAGILCKDVIDFLYARNYIVYDGLFNEVTPGNVKENYDCLNYLAVHQGQNG